MMIVLLLFGTVAFAELLHLVAALGGGFGSDVGSHGFPFGGAEAAAAATAAEPLVVEG